MRFTKFFASFIILWSGAMSYATWQAYAAVGPAWHQFMTFNRFDLTQTGIDLGMSDKEYISAQNKPFFYGQCAAQKIIGNTLLRCALGGGKVTDGSAFVEIVYNNISPEDSLPSRFEARYGASVLTFDMNISPMIRIPCSIIELSPLVGYVFNRQTVFFDTYNISNRYNYKNIWKGAYIGIKGSLLHDIARVDVWYKFAAGDVQSTLTATLQSVSSLPYSQSKNASFENNMIASLYGIHAWYPYTNRTQLGVEFSFWRYRNEGHVFVKQGSDVSGLVATTRSKLFVWQQYSLLFTVLYTF